MIGEEGKKRLIALYEETCRIIIDMEIASFQHYITITNREKDVLRTANEFKDAIWETLIHDLNVKDPYND